MAVGNGLQQLNGQRNCGGRRHEWRPKLEQEKPHANRTSEGSFIGDQYIQ